MKPVTPADSPNPEPRLYDKIVRILQTDLEEKSAVVRWAAWKLKLIYEIFEKFWKDDCLTFAASLAYTSLLALAPLTAVSLSILSSFEISKKSVLGFVFSRLLPNDELARIIEENIDTFSANAASVSIWGLILLAIFSVWVLSTIEYSFNMIWKVGGSRPIISQFVTYWSSVTFAPILIALSIFLTATIRETVMSNEWADYTYAQSFTLQAIPYLLTIIAFFLVYKLIPYTNVHFRPAMLGAICGGIMFEQAKNAFNYYLSNFASYEAIYGAMAVIPIFLFWLYVTWVIVLLGSVIAYAIQYPKEIKALSVKGFDRSDYFNYYGLRILMEATRAFEAGKGSVTPKEILHKLEITGEFYELIVNRLKTLDLIEPIHESSGDFLLKKPPETILVGELLMNLSGELLGTPPEPPDYDRDTLTALFATIGAAINKDIHSLDLLTLAQQSSPSEEVEQGEETDA